MEIRCLCRISTPVKESVQVGRLTEFSSQTNFRRQ